MQLTGAVYLQRGRILAAEIIPAEKKSKLGMKPSGRKELVR